MTLLALLLAALPPGASLAAGLQAEAVSCCCSDGSAPADVSSRFDAPSCCKMSDGASLPTTSPATESAAPSPPLDTHADRDAAPVELLVFHAPPLEIEPDLGKRPPPSLFTLHAAFLI